MENGKGDKTDIRGSREVRIWIGNILEKCWKSVGNDGNMLEMMGNDTKNGGKMAGIECIVVCFSVCECGNEMCIISVNDINDDVIHQ